MATAERPPPADRANASAARGRRAAWAGLALVLAGGLGLRLWGVQQGLPYPYNADEQDHFVPHAIEMFEHGTLNPHYFANPPAFTYVLHFLFAIAYGGAHGAVREFALHPASVYTLARVAAAVLGTLALWLLYLAGARLWSRAAGLLAAAIEAVAFLPVFYAHLALNDAPTLAPATLSLLGSAGVLRKGRLRDYLLAGLGLGLACASKYTAGIVLLALLAASSWRLREQRRAVAGLVLAGAAALVAFLLANPYALLDFKSFHAELLHQSSLSGEAQGKLGAPRGGGLPYYLWSFTWGLGWAPSLAAAAGALTVWRRDRRIGWMLVPPLLVFLAFMGTQGRYFGRWLMPVFPIACLLGACFVIQLSGWAARALPTAGRRHVLAALLVLALLAQGLVYSIHAGMVLSRADTRNLTRRWMLAHIPAGAKVVAEPVEPEEWAREVAPGTATATNPYRWQLYPALYLRVQADGRIAPRYIREVGLEDYERTLYPALVGFYEREGYCWVIRGSTESGRAFAEPAAVPHAIAYYRRLARAGRVVYRASPFARGASGREFVPFNFDWSFDYYPLAYARPGPRMTIYRLRGGRCRRR
ncbi:MAG TPA: glycosyltransferase family 39 protein [Solirubrobacteraceae bacterium]|nr:glycosyltransferase family 39 protein [Solirubrobacteraceae bacterium]